MLKTYKIIISGQVQGVGFRPFVYNLANEFNLKGTVSNNEKGVLIFISGTQKNIDLFYYKLINFPPPVSKIKQHTICEIDTIEFQKFQIISSQKKGQLNLPLTPDFAICNDCKNDIENTENKRFNYAFTTCVNCGPRYAITQNFPFERSNTSIDDFQMCDNCKSEYENPLNRRFHSQTNSCSTCGITLFLVNKNGVKLTISNNQIFDKISELLLKGNIIAIKNTSGYLLCCNAENKGVIQKLRNLKNRPKKPFAVLYPSLEFLKNEFHISEEEQITLTSVIRPITIISSKNYQGKIALNEIAPELNQLGVMLPYSAILQLLANKLNFPIVATSGNIHGSPILSNNDEAYKKLKNIADYFLHHNLKIMHPQDDSVVKFSTKFKQEILFRRARGFAPNYFNAISKTREKIMALGADLKSTITFFPNKYLYVSEYIGNLENYDVYKRYASVVESFISIFEQKPAIVLIDEHPLYQSSQFGKEIALKYESKLFKIQHHKAHFAAILGEHNLFDKQVLGVIFDGTGYGEDSQIWGGEFFVYDKNLIKRINHFKYFDWLLGNKMAKEPRLSLLSLASEEMDEILEQKFTKEELKNYKFLKTQNKLKTSSVGRLFDAVASLLNICNYNSYEGEAAILLENSISTYNMKTCKNYSIKHEFSPFEIVENVYYDYKSGLPKEQIIINFLFTLANSILKFSVKNNYYHVAFGGGVFQNTTLIDMLLELAPKQIKLYFHKEISPNDENVSFGQFMYYTYIKN